MSDWLRDAVVIDYETLPIRERPRHPPAPVGVSVGFPNRKSVHYGWGYTEGNQTNGWAAARAALGEAYDSGRPLLFHNAPFDVDVGEVHMGLPRLPWDRYHDTMPMLFLRDPRAPDFRLKESAERILGEPPEERDAVVEWLIDHQPIPSIKMSLSRNSEKYAGAYIALAPGRLVGAYANGDVDRTIRLAEKVYRELEAAKMVGAYDRERRLMLHILEMERQGLRMDMTRLEADVARYERELANLETWLRRRMKAGDDLNLDSGQQLANALIAAKLATREAFGVTAKTGKMQTNKESLAGAVGDRQVLGALKYRTQLGTCLKTFMRPWLETAQASGGYIFTTWHSTRTDRGDSGVGTRTGRLSSTPNFMNVPKEFAPIFADAGHKELPPPPYDIPPLPAVRSYIAPYESDHVILDRDYSQQEPRILAHYEDGALKDAYLANPWVDFHTFAQERLADAGIKLDRKPVKIINLGLIYGMGIGKLAEKIDRSIEDTKRIKTAILEIYPGLKALYADMKQLAADNQPLRTWGGRRYYCEEPKFIDGQLRKFDYKMVNILIQGSAADCTKEAMIRYCEAKPKHHRLLLSVHDELVISAPRKEMVSAMELLRANMETVEFDVAMKSEGSWSDKNWHDLQTYDKAGKLEPHRSK